MSGRHWNRWQEQRDLGRAVLDLRARGHGWKLITAALGRSRWQLARYARIVSRERMHQQSSKMHHRGAGQDALAS